MEGSGSLINIGELSRPATVLVERISDAVGGYFRPHQIRRVAKAEADADKIRVSAELEVTELRRRALQRFVAEEERKQENIEGITSRALPHVQDDAAAEEVDEDWLVNFLDKAKLISSEEMQEIWARVLAGEANAPGSYSKRTVNYLSSLDREDARLFARLCSFACHIGSFVPLVYEVNDEIYSRHGISFADLTHLDDIGLIRFESLTGFVRQGLSKKVHCAYGEDLLVMEFPGDEKNSVDLGKVLLSKVGRELAPMALGETAPEILDYLVGKWTAAGVAVSCPFPRRNVVYSGASARQTGA